MRKLLLVVTLAVLALPATALAKDSGSGAKNAAKICKAMRADMGASTFKAMFPARKGKSSLGRCVAAQRKARRQARKRARKACRAKGLRGQAMKRCVREALSGDVALKPGADEEGMRECKEEQAEDPEEFADRYGEGSAGLDSCIAEPVDEEEPAEDEEPEPDDPLALPLDELLGDLL